MPFVRFPSELFTLRDVAAMAIMVRIIMRMDKDGLGVCFETRTSMCEALGIDKKTWSAKIRKLEDKGWILVDRKPKVPNQIALTNFTKDLLRGKNGSLTRSNMDLDWGGNFPQIEDSKEKKKSVVRRRRPTNKIDNPLFPPDPPMSEIDAIHRRWLKKSSD